MSYAFIREHREEFRVSVMCRVLGVSRSGYYAWRGRPESMRSYRNRQLVTQIRLVYARSRRIYGSPRVTDELRATGVVCSEKRVARLMRVSGIRSKTAKKYRVTTDSRHQFPVAPNHLQRVFTVAGPDQVWLGDITYIHTGEGWLYLAAVLDLHSRRIVGWAMSSRVDSQLALTALRQAVARRHPPAGLMHHSDRGVQYAATAYQKALADQQMVCSMSRAGDCWDNAPMESFFATLKRELIHHEHFATHQEAISAIFEYIEVFYNGQRRHSRLGSVSPIDYEQRTRQPMDSLF